MKKSILIVGGAGYIGSHTAYLLAQSGYQVIIVDSFLHSQVFDVSWATVIKADFADPMILKSIFSRYHLDAVMHFAALIEVGESVKKPREFYDNNVVKVVRLLDTMLAAGVRRFIFSSSCAVYGIPHYVPMDERHSHAPINPYGKTKLVVDYMLQDYAKSYGLDFVSLRYFNAAGAWPEQGLGECHNPETHVIPLLFQALTTGKPFSIFGDDYNTADGTCVRDYIHVRDIAQAHVLALRSLEQDGNSAIFNLGSGTGFSVAQLITAAERIANCKAHVVIKPRRDGDVPVLVADPAHVKAVLGWQPEYSDLHTMLASAYSWQTMKEMKTGRQTACKQVSGL